jgi:Zn-dependent peptidase ImmA (M78 family)
VSAVKPAVYRRKKRAELKRLATEVLEKCPTRRKDWAVDIEGIVEDFGLDLLFRSLKGISVEAYIARATNVIVINQDYVHHRARYRFTVAEELSHRILEFKLLEPGKHEIPEAKRVHELSDAEYRAIEADASCLAAEILQPEADYRQRFAHYAEQHRLEGRLTGDALFKATVRSVSHDFDVSLSSSAYRARVLGLISQSRYDILFAPSL